MARRLPFGLFSWRFLLPGQPENVRIHRQLVWQHYPIIPRPLWLLVVLFGGVRWMLFYSPYYSYRALQRQWKKVHAETGLSYWQQGWQLFGASMGHGIPPSAWYQYRLYLPDQQATCWDYIYDHEAGAYHAWRNQGRPNTAKHQALLADKWQLEQVLGASGITMAQTLYFARRGDSAFSDVLQRLSQQQGTLFCKQRTGNQARGAFLARWQAGQLVIQPFGKALLQPPACKTFLQQRIAEADYLIQPEYRNHPALTPDHDHLPAATLRIISYCGQDNAITLGCAYLEWPMADGEGHIHHFPLPILPLTGQVAMDALAGRTVTAEQQQALETLRHRLAGKPLPCWQEAVSMVTRGHQQLLGLYAIAWDFILTEDGAVLLEGNSGWRVSTPQLLQNAGLLMNPCY
ncbi:MAG: sugar-transfer associated ATP-grasp domain-containing protein [Thiothrix litoralis]|uniref:sugar-transfer associated ATP-grasp domain-containing protein n=1 Tax=Thiothrix litoralis TaxID=2891210 RepID=UPI003C728C69